MSNYIGKDVTVEISTKGRYFSTLPLVLTAISQQTVVPAKVLIFDDTENPEDLRSKPLYQYLASLLDVKGISWWVIYGQKKGQVFNHQTALQLSETPLIWRLDDDTVPEGNVLEVLLKEMTENVGAVGGIVADPTVNVVTPTWASTSINDLLWTPNLQWGKFEYVEHVQHLYSSFLFKKDAAEHGYNLELSPVCHREETMFTYEMFKNGWDLTATPRCTTWHLRYPEGGIRTYPNPAQWEHDEMVFRRKCAEWGVKMREYKLFYLSNGLGDHLAFKKVLPELKSKHSGKVLIIACYCKEVFEDEQDCIVCSREDVGYLGVDPRKHDVYAYLDSQHKKGNKLTLSNAFLEMYS